MGVGVEGGGGVLDVVTLGIVHVRDVHYRYFWGERGEGRDLDI